MRMLAPIVATLLVVVPQPLALDTLAASASGWATDFEQDLSGLLFREIYVQKADTGYTVGSALQVAPKREARLEANVFLLRVPGRDKFLVYRDVYRANNRDIADHTDRLQQALSGPTAASLAQAQRLTDESARYNVGSVTRNVNTPTMAFEYLTEKNIGRLALEDAGRDTIDGIPHIIVSFEEVGRPTLVRGEGDSDVPARGRYWVDPATGAVPRAIVEFKSACCTGRVEVRLTRHPTLNVWVPREMSDEWRSTSSYVTGTARYEGFQRLAVATDEIIK